jgi:hypothetical protein
MHLWIEGIDLEGFFECPSGPFEVLQLEIDLTRLSVGSRMVRGQLLRTSEHGKSFLIPAGVDQGRRKPVEDGNRVVSL